MKQMTDHLRVFTEQSKLIRMDMDDSVATMTNVLTTLGIDHSAESEKIFWTWKRHVTLRRYACLSNLVNAFIVYVIRVSEEVDPNISISKYKQGVVAVIEQMFGDLNEFTDQEIVTIRKWTEKRNVMTHTGGVLDKKAAEKLAALGEEDATEGLQYLPMSTDFLYAQEELLVLANKIDVIAVRSHSVASINYDSKEFDRIMSKLQSITLKNRVSIFNIPFWRLMLKPRRLLRLLWAMRPRRSKRT